MKEFGFFNSINGDRKYLASDISNAFNIALGTGLQPNKDCFKIVEHENMTVKMLSGGAMIKGCYISDVEDEIIKIDTAPGELNRIDRIVLRYDKFERSIKTVVIKGSSSLKPIPPIPLRTENQFDLVLADILVNKATVEIKEQNITDMRDSEFCGFLGVKPSLSLLKLIDSKADSSMYSKDNIINTNLEIKRDDKKLCIINRKSNNKTFTLEDDGKLNYNNNPIPLSGQPVFETSVKINQKNGIKKVAHKLGRIPIFTVSTTVGNVTPTVQVTETEILFCNYNSTNDCTITVRCY